MPEKTKESPGAPWQFVGLLSLFDPPRHDSAETIRRALNLGVNVKMITGIYWITHLLCLINSEIYTSTIYCSIIFNIQVTNLPLLRRRGGGLEWERICIRQLPYLDKTGMQA